MLVQTYSPQSYHVADINMNTLNNGIRINNRFAVKSHSTSSIFNKEDILYISADSNYSTIILKNGSKVFTSKTLKYWEIKFKDIQLLRVHKSYLVNTLYIQNIHHVISKIELNTGIFIPVSRSLKKVVFGLFCL
ncbi:MAG: LytTR family transcriptional regulator [Saprospiraceae bacterium]|nr:LytTR family transcriptional regulator [Saprospiraceae bacterium]